MREVVAGLRLIPVGLECRANQINSRVELRLYKIGDRDIARVHKMVIWDQFLFSQIGMDRCEDSLRAARSRSGLDMGDELWSEITRRSG